MSTLLEEVPAIVVEKQKKVAFSFIFLFIHLLL
jgi:hypothetical protein